MVVPVLGNGTLLLVNQHRYLLDSVITSYSIHYTKLYEDQKVGMKFLRYPFGVLFNETGF